MNIFCIKSLEVPDSIEINHKINGKINLYFYFFFFFYLLKKYKEYEAE